MPDRLLKNIVGEFRRFGRFWDREVFRPIRDNAAEIGKWVATVDPMWGIGMTALGGGNSDDYLKTIGYSLFGNIVSGDSLLNIKGRSSDVIVKAFSKTLEDPKRLALNYLSFGGDLKKAVATTMLQHSSENRLDDDGNVIEGYADDRYTNFANDIITGTDPLSNTTHTGDILGSFLNGIGIDFNDPVRATAIAAAWYEIYKNKPKKLPTIPELNKYTDEMRLERMRIFKEDLDEATQERVDIVHQRMSARGIRGGIGDAQERKIMMERDKLLARQEADLIEKQLEYNNVIKQQKHAMEVGNWQMAEELRKEKIENLLDFIDILSINNSEQSKTYNDIFDMVNRELGGVGMSAEKGDSGITLNNLITKEQFKDYTTEVNRIEQEGVDMGLSTEEIERQRTEYLQQQGLSQPVMQHFAPTLDTDDVKKNN